MAAVTQVPGLHLTLSAVDSELQDELVSQVQSLLVQGRSGELLGKTYSPVPPNFGPYNQVTLIDFSVN